MTLVNGITPFVMTVFARINSFKQIFTFQFISNHVYVVEERKSRPAVKWF